MPMQPRRREPDAGGRPRRVGGIGWAALATILIGFIGALYWLALATAIWVIGAAVAIVAFVWFSVLTG